MQKICIFYNKWIVFFLSGCWKLEIIPVKFEDFDPEYKEINKEIDHDKVGLIVCNH